MPRRPRCHLPGVPAHVIQRGNNRQPCFFCPDDYATYRRFLAEALQRHGVQLHAYVLMTNHVHLLMTPPSADAISRVMQHTGRQYVAHVNKARRRTGTLWEGRHKASLIDAEQYLFACHRYIELNPVRAGMVSDPADYAWSSYRHYALGIMDALITPHELHDGLGVSATSRHTAWRDLVSDALAVSLIDDIRTCSAGNFPLGGKGFQREIESALRRRVGQVQRGRPRGNGGAPASENLTLF